MKSKPRIPKYMIIKNQILEDINQGVYAVGEAIPSDNELMRNLSVSKSTITQALKSLESEGYISRQQGRGSFVLPRPQSKVVLNLSICPMEHEEEQFWTSLVNEFNQTSQDFQISLTFLSNQNAPLRDILFQSFASGNAPDLFSLDGPDVPYWAYMNSLLPLDDYLPESFLGTFIEPILQQGTFRGHIYHLGYTESTLCILYNKELFSSLGIPVPKTLEEAWSWDEFTDICSYLKKHTSVPYPLLMDSGRGLSPRLGEWLTFSGLPFIYQNNGSLFSPDFSRTEGYINSPETVAAMEWLGNLFHKYHYTHTENISSSFPGSFAMSLSLPSAYFQAAKQCDTIGILPLPHARCTATPHGSWGLCMSRQTKYPELCAEFLKYVFNFQNQLKISRYTGMPVIKDIYDAMESFHAVSNQSNILFSQLRTCSFTRPQTPAYPFFSKQFSYAYYNIAQGDDPKKELDLLARLTDDHLYRHNYYNL